MIHSRFPLKEECKKRSVGRQTEKVGAGETYKNHNRAELPSGFRVNSTPSSIPTGRSMTEPIPIITKIA
jgi:hypothetical protein